MYAYVLEIGKAWDKYCFIRYSCAILVFILKEDWRLGKRIKINIFNNSS